MKLLHCLSSPNIGGIERLVIELAIVQQQKGIEVSIMLDSREGQFYDYLKQQKIPLLDSKVRGALDFNTKTYHYLKKQFDAFQIVHLHSFSPLLSTATRHSNAKVIYTIHGLSKGIRKESKIKTLFRESLKKFALNKVDVLIANSNYTLSLAKKHYGLKNTRSICLLNGIRLSEYKLTEQKLNKNLTIGLVSRFTPRKRIDRLIEAFKKFKEAGGKGNLVMVGDGTEFEFIKKLIEKLDLTNNVELVGYSNQVEEFYDQFDLCVFPSQDEPFGLVAVEAYLHGKAVLVFNDSAGLKEVIEPLEPENIVNTVEAMAKRLLYWSENKKELHSHAEERKKYAIDHFSLERMANDYLKVYEEELR